jgi:hypothetical protein
MTVLIAMGSARGAAPDPRPFPLLIMQQILGTDHGAGLALLTIAGHLGYGALMGLAFAFFARPMTVGKGFGWGLFLWALMQVTFVPWLGWGDFGLARGGGFTVYTLVLHVAYGGVLGWFAARDERVHRARFDDLGRLVET